MRTGQFKGKGKVQIETGDQTECNRKKYIKIGWWVYKFKWGYNTEMFKF